MFNHNGNTPVLTPFALNVYDVNIVFNHGMKINAKEPLSIYHFMFQRLKIVVDGIFVLADTL